MSPVLIKISPPGAWHAYAGRFIHIVWQQSLLDPCERPLIRFVGVTGVLSAQPMNAAYTGVGSWMGQVPATASGLEMELPPGSRVDAFRVLQIKPMSWLHMWWRGFINRPGTALFALSPALKRDFAFVAQILLIASASTPLSQYDQWLSRHHRDFDPGGLDRNDALHPETALLAFVLLKGSASAMRATLDSFRADPCPAVRLYVPAEMSGSSVDPRVETFTSLKAIEPSIRYIGHWHAGDIVVPGALTILADRVSRVDGVSILYCDEDEFDAAGRRVHPRLKPDWSPVTFAHMDLGRAVVFERTLFSKLSARDALKAIEMDDVRSLLFKESHHRVDHVRRRLCTRAFEHAQSRQAKAPSSIVPVNRAVQNASITIIIPTRDRIDLLRRCLESLPAGDERVEILVVDNDSSDPDTLDYLKRWGVRPRCRVLKAPGPFNYAEMMNRAAADCQSSLLLFLNNDVEVQSADFMDSMLVWTMREDVGAVGAKLTFPNGTLQHAGVVTGLGGYAGHIYRMEPGNAPGFLGELCYPREVSAVTGACLMIRRVVFEAVGGFDAEPYPVEFNDIDLCLRLRAEGLRIVWTPDAELMHFESASRERSAEPFRRYARERERYAEQWIEARREDPNFHPALSLQALAPALG